MAAAIGTLPVALASPQSVNSSFKSTIITPTLRSISFLFQFHIGLSTVDMKHLCTKLNHVEYKDPKSVVVTDIDSGGARLEIFSIGSVKSMGGTTLRSETDVRAVADRLVIQLKNIGYTQCKVNEFYISSIVGYYSFGKTAMMSNIKQVLITAGYDDVSESKQGVLTMKGGNGKIELSKRGTLAISGHKSVSDLAQHAESIAKICSGEECWV